MGSQFAIVYDIIVLAVMAGMVFCGFRKGFASTVASLAAVFVAFFLAMTFSEPIADGLYKYVVEEPIEEAVDSTLDSTMGTIMLSGMDDVDYSMVTVSGVPADEIEPKYEGTGKAVFDLSDLGLSGTGIENADLSLFGITADTDFSSVNARTAEFTMSEIESYGIGKLCVAQYIAANAVGSDFFDSLCEYTAAVGSVVPDFFGTAFSQIEGGSIAAVRSVVLNMIDSSSSVKEAIIGGMIEPSFIMGAQTVAFIVIFGVVCVVIELIAWGLKVVNKIPLLGKVNAFLGGVAGLIQGLITVFIICVAVRLVVTLSGGDMMFFNEMTINSTYIFGTMYNFDFLNFLT